MHFLYDVMHNLRQTLHISLHEFSFLKKICRDVPCTIDYIFPTLGLETEPINTSSRVQSVLDGNAVSGASSGHLLEVTMPIGLMGWLTSGQGAPIINICGLSYASAWM